METQDGTTAEAAGQELVEQRRGLLRFTLN